MSLPVDITFNGRTANVTLSGQLVVGALAYDETSFNELAEVNTAYNFYKPKSQHAFIITRLLAFADKDINDASDTVVVVYEASAENTATVDKTLLQFGMGKLTVLPLQLNLFVNEGKYLNAKTGDDDIHLTIMGYYVPQVTT